MPGMVCGALFFIGLGLLMIFARDLMWTLTQFSNELAGRASERTATWETGQTIAGVVAVGFGVVLILFVLGEAQQERQTIDAISTSATAQLYEAQMTYGTPIATLQDVPAGRALHIAPALLGIEASDVLYGRCGSGFFAFIFDKESKTRAYAYVQNGSPGSCHPDGMTISAVDDIGGGWYRLFAYGIDRDLTVTAMLSPILAPATPTRPAPTAETTAAP